MVKNIKIGLKEIKDMVNECVNRILNERHEVHYYCWFEGEFDWVIMKSMFISKLTAEEREELYDMLQKYGFKDEYILKFTANDEYGNGASLDEDDGFQEDVNRLPDCRFKDLLMEEFKTYVKEADRMGIEWLYNEDWSDD